MRVEVIRRDKGKCEARLPNGEFFIIDERELPRELRSGGEGFLFVSPFNGLSFENAKNLVNYLLREEQEA